jgi:hypothetical protein
LLPVAGKWHFETEKASHILNCSIVAVLAAIQLHATIAALDFFSLVSIHQVVMGNKQNNIIKPTSMLENLYLSTRANRTHLVQWKVQ